MAAPLVVPFNFQPTAASVKTGSYTIPAGSYARVVVNLEGSATFTIDTVTALRGTQNSVLGSSGLITQTQNIEASSAGIATTFSGQVLIARDGEVNGGTNNSGSNAFTAATDQKTIVAEYWLPTGTVINGTGTWRAAVMLYNEIT